jgi:hypothetical protein
VVNVVWGKRGEACSWEAPRHLPCCCWCCQQVRVVVVAAASDAAAAAAASDATAVVCIVAAIVLPLFQHPKGKVHSPSFAPTPQQWREHAERKLEAFDLGQLQRGQLLKVRSQLLF